MKRGILTLLLLTITKFVISQDTLQYGNGFWSIGGQVYIYDNIISQADPKTFKCIDAEYGMDQKHVFFVDKLMEAIDASSFQVLESGYTKDKNHVYYDYYSGKIIEGADPSSFEVFDPSITKDKNFVYNFENFEKIVTIKDVDAITFHKYCIFFRDKNNLYNCFGGILIDIRNCDEQYIRDIAVCEE